MKRSDLIAIADRAAGKARGLLEFIDALRDEGVQTYPRFSQAGRFW